MTASNASKQLGADRRAQLGACRFGPHDLFHGGDRVGNPGVAALGTIVTPLAGSRRFEIVAEGAMDRLGPNTRAGGRPGQPRRRRLLVGDDVLGRLQVARLAGECEADQHPEGRPERGHQRCPDALHVVVLVRRNDRPGSEPRAEGDQQGQRQPAGDEDSHRLGGQPVHTTRLLRVAAGVTGCSRVLADDRQLLIDDLQGSLHGHRSQTAETIVERVVEVLEQ